MVGRGKGKPGAGLEALKVGQKEGEACSLCSARLRQNQGQGEVENDEARKEEEAENQQSETNSKQSFDVDDPKERATQEQDPSAR